MSNDRKAPSVVMVPTQYVASQFAQVASQLRGAGATVKVYDSAKACLGDRAQLEATDVVLTMHNFPMSRDFIASMPNVRAALSFITGTEGFDEKAATDLGVLVANGQIAENFQSMAEATIMLVLAAFYDLRGAEQAFRSHTKPAGQFRASMLMGKTIGIVGFGKIARAVVERLTAWGIRLQVTTRRADVVLPSGVTRIELDDLCRTSDCIILLANLNTESHHLLDARRISLVKPGAVLVNTARGGLVDEIALVRAVQEGRFRALALDTFEEEPLALDSPLRELRNAILTDHDVGHTIETHEGLVNSAVINIQRILLGVLPDNIRNPDVIERWLQRWRGVSIN